MKYKKRPGSTIININAQLREENRKVSNDTYNRDYVVRTVIGYIKEDGLSEEESLEKIMKDSIVKEFAYFEKYHIDIKERFREWVRNEIDHPRRRNGRIVNSKDNEER